MIEEFQNIGYTVGSERSAVHAREEAEREAREKAEREKIESLFDELPHRRSLRSNRERRE